MIVLCIVQRAVGHRDRAAVRPVHWAHGRRDVAVAGAGPARVRVGRLRRLRQAVGCPRLSVQTDIPGTRERHQCGYGKQQTHRHKFY